MKLHGILGITDSGRKGAIKLITAAFEVGRVHVFLGFLSVSHSLCRSVCVSPGTPPPPLPPPPTLPLPSGLVSCSSSIIGAGLLPLVVSDADSFVNWLPLRNSEAQLRRF